MELKLESGHGMGGSPKVRRGLSFPKNSLVSLEAKVLGD